MIASFLSGILSIFPHLIIVVACFYFVIKKPGADSALLAIGSAIVLIPTVFYSIILPLIWKYDSFYSKPGIETYMLVGRIVSVLGSLLFASGLVLLIVKTVNESNKGKYTPYL